VERIIALIEKSSSGVAHFALSSTAQRLFAFLDFGDQGDGQVEKKIAVCCLPKAMRQAAFVHARKKFKNA
jgi:hypothetical protein